MMTDSEIIDAALRHYHMFLSDAGCAMAQKSFRFKSGRELTANEVSEVLDTARRTAEILRIRAETKSNGEAK
jgi:hypothetical protein